MQNLAKELKASDIKNLLLKNLPPLPKRRNKRQ